MLSNFDLDALEADFNRSLLEEDDVEPEAKAEENGVASEDHSDDEILITAVNNQDESKEEEEVFCTCRGKETEYMLECLHEEACRGFQWYHYDCVDVEENAIPAVWICDFCA
jgi:hypothetical protein